jgi:ABC-type phosphate transport system ATPase subunit
MLEQHSKSFLSNIFTGEEANYSVSEIGIMLQKDNIERYLFHSEIDVLIPCSLFSKEIGSIKVYKKTDEKVFNLTMSFFRNDMSDVSLIDVDQTSGLMDFFTWSFKKIISYHFNNVFINTAERSAINIFSKELSIKRNNIVDQLLELRDSKNGDANQLLGKLQRYPLPIRDSLAISEDLANLSRNKSEYAFLADKMEDVLLDGRINISQYGEVQFSPNKSKVKNLSMNLSGSIVKSLSSLVIYFRHLAQKGDFIIIDEPELNLHPDNQRKITRLIGEFINHGFKVMISTHSDYIIREINNMTMLKVGGDKAEYLANKYGYKTEQLIDYQKIGAYLFHKNKNISLEVTEIGFEVGTIDEEINNLNNASEEIYFTLFD